MSRLQNSIRNIKYAIFLQMIGIIVSFFTRSIFIKVLSAEYLGVNGVFSNILSLLSLAELGIGSSITYSMYKPLAEKDTFKIKALMELYKKTYTSIGVFILCIGFFITPFLKFIIKDLPSLEQINTIYFLFIINSAMTYFFSYKRSLIIADQKRYITTLYRYVFYILMNIIQIIVLIFFKNYFLYLVVQIVATTIENIYISKKADEMYPFLREDIACKLEKEDKEIIIKNVKALTLSKVGGLVVSATDNLVISKFIGIFAVGVYSNYYMVINALNIVFGLIFQSLTASVGNLGVKEERKYQKKLFEVINFCCFWIFGWASICLFNLFNPFIKIWVGQEYLFPTKVVILIAVNFYITGVRNSIFTFKDALGLYYYDRYRPLFEAAVNLFLSIYLAKKIGIPGILLGTILSTILTCLLVEPYILYKYGFKEKCSSYFFKYSVYSIAFVIINIITVKLCALNNNFILNLVICLIIPNILFLILFFKASEFSFLRKRLLNLSVLKKKLV